MNACGKEGGTLKEGRGKRHSSGESAFCTCRAIILSYNSFRSSTWKAVLGNPSMTSPAVSAFGSKMVSRRASPTCSQGNRFATMLKTTCSYSQTSSIPFLKELKHLYLALFEECMSSWEPRYHGPS